MLQMMPTSDETNRATCKIIKRNGGVLEDISQLPHYEVPIMRWWITPDQ